MSTQCGSCSLTPAQKNYAAVELELCATWWVAQKCDLFLLGLKGFTVKTDFFIYLANIYKLNHVQLSYSLPKFFEEPAQRNISLSLKHQSRTKLPRS